MSMSGFRRACRSIPGLYWLHGLFRYLQFRLAVLVTDFGKLRVCPEDGLPVPPAKLRHRVHGDLDRERFLRVGRTCAEDIRRLLGEVGRDLSSFERILDFGCGCARVLRSFRAQASEGRFHGTDIDPEAIAWCSENLPDLARWSVNTDRPPTAGRDGDFDLIYSISVFTHLDETCQFDWLAELGRLARVGGHLILTVHGPHCQQSLDEEEKSRLSEKGFLYKVGRTGRLKLDGLPDFYQSAFHTREYIEREWTRYFKVERYVERGINDHQDAVILRRE